jgi:UDP-GlcNAc:undecaprenyl-phosphate/decaprenyl-phosphate GlcNAc-1-phosphate transferase
VHILSLAHILYDSEQLLFSNIPYMHSMTPLFYWKEGVVFFISLAIGAAIVALARRMPDILTLQKHLSAVQTTHVDPTPRLGGIAIFSALIVSVPLLHAITTQRYMLLIIATSVIFIVGLAEDLTGRVPPRMRLAAAFVSSILVIALLGLWLPRAGIPGLDTAMSYWWVGVPITLVLTAGIANGFNLIDGVNGLAAMTALIAALSFSIIADTAGLVGLSHINLMLAASVAGFLVLNFPAGKIFLGDSGAYVLGFVLSWLGIGILINNPDVTPWAILLVLFWPVADTMLAIYRRRSKRRHAMAPDRLHAHQLVMRVLELCGVRRSLANPLTTVILLPFIAIPAMLGTLFWDKPLIAFICVVIFGLCFVIAYMIAFKLIWKYRRSQRSRKKPTAS